VYKFLKPYQKGAVTVLGGSSKKCASLYCFTGKVLETKTTHTGNIDTNEILQTNSYDHAGRLLEVKQKLNTEDEIVLLENNFNELGELIEKNLHSEDDGESVDYRYNIRGWLTSINNAALDGTTANNNDTGQVRDLFGMELAYNTGFAGITSTAMDFLPFTGQI